MRYDKYGLVAAILIVSSSAVAQAQPPPPPSLIKEYIYADSRVIAVDSPAATPPTVSAGSGNPTNLTGQPAGTHTGTFVVRGTSVNGGTYIQLVEGIFTARPYVDARDSCLFLASGDGTIYLKKDDGTGWVQPNGSPAGSFATVSNTQCSINLSSTSVVLNGNDLVVTINISFFPIFAGTQNLFLLAVDNANASTNGWMQVPGYILTAQNIPPKNFTKTVSASNTDGMGAAFAYTFTNPGGQFGAKYISSGLLMLNSWLDSNNACYIQFFRVDRSFRMLHSGISGIAGNSGPFIASLRTHREQSYILQGGSRAVSTATAADRCVRVSFRHTLLLQFSSQCPPISRRFHSQSPVRRLPTGSQRPTPTLFPTPNTNKTHSPELHGVL